MSTRNIVSLFLIDMAEGMAVVISSMVVHGGRPSSRKVIRGSSTGVVLVDVGMGKKGIQSPSGVDSSILVPSAGVRRETMVDLPKLSWVWTMTPSSAKAST